MNLWAVCCELTPALQQFPSSLQAFTILLLSFRADFIYHVFPEFPPRKIAPNQEIYFRYIPQRPRDANATAPLNTGSIYQCTTNLFSDFMPVAYPQQAPYSHRAAFVLSLDGAFSSCLSTDPRTRYIKNLIRLEVVQRSFQSEGSLYRVKL